MKEIEELKTQAIIHGQVAVGIQNKLMQGINLPFIKRYELEVDMYENRLEQSKLNLRYQQTIKWAMEQYQRQLEEQDKQS